MNTNLNVGIWSYQVRDIKNGVYRGSDTNILFLQHMLALLNVRNLTWVSVEENGWLDLSNKNSLTNQLRSGLIDVHSGLMIVNFERLKLFNFSFPVTFEQMSLAAPKDSPATPYLQLNSSPLWTFILLILFLIRLAILSKSLFIPIPFRKLRLTSLILILIGIGLSVAFKCYKINLTAAAVAPSAEVPKTLAQLAEKLEAGSYRLVDKGPNTFVFEEVNKSDSKDFTSLKRALDKFPTHIVAAHQICHTVAVTTVDQPVKYVYLNTDDRTRLLCERYLSQMQIVQVPSALYYARSFIFSPNCKKLRDSITYMAASGNLAVYRHYMFMAKAGRENGAPKKTTKFKKSDKFLIFRNLQFYRQVFQVFLGTIGLCILAWIIEVSKYSKLLQNNKN